MELLLTPWLGMPAWAWLAFMGVCRDKASIPL